MPPPGAVQWAEASTVFHGMVQRRNLEGTVTGSPVTCRQELMRLTLDPVKIH